jgi:type IV secretory pathway VirB10-like protein
MKMKKLLLFAFSCMMTLNFYGQTEKEQPLKSEEKNNSGKESQAENKSLSDKPKQTGVIISKDAPHVKPKEKTAKEKAREEEAQRQKEGLARAMAEDRAEEKEIAEKRAAKRMEREKEIAAKDAEEREKKRIARENKMQEGGDGKSHTKHRVAAPIGSETKYKAAIARADDYFKTKRYKEAKLEYEAALRIKADDPYANGRVNECAKLSVSK